MRGAVLVLILADCSSESAAPPDLAAEPPACMFVLSGDVSGTDGCYPRLCRGPTGDGIDLSGLTPRGPEADFCVDGPFTIGRSYTAADLKTFNAVVRKGFSTVSYLAGHQVFDSTVTITLTDVEWKADDTCPTGGVVHGTAQIGLIESVTDDGGTQPPGHVMLDATF